MLTKLKVCTGCGKEKLIWKNNGRDGGRYCKHCWSCHKSKENKSQKPKSAPSSSRIAQKSEKQKALDKAYSLMRKEYLTKHPMCEINLPGVCKGNACDIHHTAYRGINTLAQATWLAACRECHEWCHSHPKEARELGYLK
jgi:hypothetical protein